jgi:hypothetical protein
MDFAGTPQLQRVTTKGAGHLQNMNPRTMGSAKGHGYGRAPPQAQALGASCIMQMTF